MPSSFLSYKTKTYLFNGRLPAGIHGHLLLIILLDNRKNLLCLCRLQRGQLRLHGIDGFHPFFFRFVRGVAGVVRGGVGGGCGGAGLVVVVRAGGLWLIRGSGRNSYVRGSGAGSAQWGANQNITLTMEDWASLKGRRRKRTWDMMRLG